VIAGLKSQKVTLMLWRGQEFNIDEVRFATNGVDNERTFADNVAGINDTRFFRIVRNQGTNFSFFWKTNATDTWVRLTNTANYPNGVYTRADLAGIPLQVGIAHALFSGNSAQVFFTDFELTGPNVNPPSAMPSAPSNVTFNPVNSNSIAISWTTNGGDFSALGVARMWESVIVAKQFVRSVNQINLQLCGSGAKHAVSCSVNRVLSRMVAYFSGEARSQ